MSCPLPGDVVMLTTATAEQLRGCDIGLGVTFRVHYQEERMDPVQTAEAGEVVVVEVPAAAHPAPTPPAPVEVQAEPVTQAAPVAGELIDATGLPDVSQLQALAGESPMLLLALAVLFVVGGGAGWRFWLKLSEQKHEQAMAKLAIDRELAGLNGAQPPPCQAAAAKMQREIDALEKRVGKVERRPSATLPSDFDGDDLIARVERLEKAAKAPARKGTA